MFPGAEDNPKLLKVARRQQGVLHRRQLPRTRPHSPVMSAPSWRPAVGRRSGTRWSYYRTLRCSADQLLWLAVLDAEGLVALGSHTALELAGFTTHRQGGAADPPVVTSRREGEPIRRASRTRIPATAGLKTSSSAVGCPAPRWSGRRSTPQPGNRFLVLHV